MSSKGKRIISIQKKESGIGKFKNKYTAEGETILSILSERRTRK